MLLHQAQGGRSVNGGVKHTLTEQVRSGVVGTAEDSG